MSMSIQVVSGIALLGVMGTGYFLIKSLGEKKKSEKEIIVPHYSQPQERIKISKDEVKSSSIFINNSNTGRNPQYSRNTTPTRKSNSYVEDDNLLNSAIGFGIINSSVSHSHKHSYDHSYSHHDSHDCGSHSSYDSGGSYDSGSCDCGGCD